MHFVSKHAPPCGSGVSPRWSRLKASLTVESSENEGVLNVNYFCAFLKDAKKVK